MENKRKALGRGLEQLFNSENIDFDSIENEIYENSTSEEVKEISLDELRPNPYQPRKIFNDESLKELSDSIKNHGVFQPIIIKKSIKGYEIIAGERRVRASKLAGLTTIPAIIRQFSDDQMMEIALLENLQRENLSSIEEANAYRTMIDKLNLTQDDLARKLGKSRSHITNMLGLLRLPEEVQQMVAENKLSASHARILSKYEDHNQIILMANRIINEQLAVHEVEQMSNSSKITKKNKMSRKVDLTDFSYVEEIMREKLDAKIRIKDKKIEISFTNVADLNRILDILNIKG